MEYTVMYSANNSGGRFRHNESDARLLLNEGWYIPKQPYDFESPSYESYEDWETNDDWRGVPTYFYKKVEAESFDEALRLAVEEFEYVTGLNVRDEGCNCCGPPHNFSAYDTEGRQDYLIVDFPSVGSLPWD